MSLMMLQRERQRQRQRQREERGERRDMETKIERYRKREI